MSKLSIEIQKKYCPIFKPVDLIGDCWTLLIIKQLIAGPRRYNEIRGGIPDINNRTLSARLKSLVSKGIIFKTIIENVVDTTPAVCRYELTEIGYGTTPILIAIEEFGNKFLC